MVLLALDDVHGVLLTIKKYLANASDFIHVSSIFANDIELYGDIHFPLLSVIYWMYLAGKDVYEGLKWSTNADMLNCIYTSSGTSCLNLALEHLLFWDLTNKHFPKVSSRKWFMNWCRPSSSLLRTSMKAKSLTF